MSTETPLISLEEAKSIVAHLEANEVESANDIVQDVTARESKELFHEVGKLTRHLHSSLSNFNVDDRLTNITTSQIPDAQSRLAYVIEETEKAANTTMDAVERSMPLAESLNERLESVMPEWKKLMTKQIELGEFKTLCYQLDTLLTDARNDSITLNNTLTEVLMAQGYQENAQDRSDVVQGQDDVDDLLSSLGF